MDWIARRAELLSDEKVFGKAVILHTEYPIASDSNDYKHPEMTGATRDATDGSAFAAQYLSLFPETRTALDIGCALGTVPMGYRWAGLEAYGLEGVDAAKNNKLWVWSWFPEILATCDVAKPYRLTRPDGSPFLFDLITSWGVFEHIPSDAADQFIRNIRDHLSPGGRAVLALDVGWNELHMGVPRGISISELAAKWKAQFHLYFDEDKKSQQARAWLHSRPTFNEMLTHPRAEVVNSGYPVYQGVNPMENRFYLWLKHK